jgi:hypothetical protein
VLGASSKGIGAGVADVDGEGFEGGVHRHDERAPGVGIVDAETGLGPGVEWRLVSSAADHVAGEGVQHAEVVRFDEERVRSGGCPSFLRGAPC